MASTAPRGRGRGRGGFDPSFRGASSGRGRGYSVPPGGGYGRGGYGSYGANPAAMPYSPFVPPTMMAPPAAPPAFYGAPGVQPLASVCSTVHGRGLLPRPGPFASFVSITSVPPVCLVLFFWASTLFFGAMATEVQFLMASETVAPKSGLRCT